MRNSFGIAPGLVALALVVAAPMAAQEAQSPYAGEEEREIKALSADEVDGLRQGAGLGLARTAELNGIPGPLHVLDLASELHLSPEQVEAVQREYDAMKSEAVRLGNRLLERERQLETLFRHERPEVERVRELAAEAGRIRGELRAVHLLAHLRVEPLLTEHQVQRYRTLRGYGHGGLHGPDAGHHDGTTNHGGPPG